MEILFIYTHFTEINFPSEHIHEIDSTKAYQSRQADHGNGLPANHFSSLLPLCFLCQRIEDTGVEQKDKGTEIRHCSLGNEKAPNVMNLL